MKKLLAILGIIISSMPAYSAQWSGANVNPEAVKVIFEKYVQSADKVEAMLRVLNDNMDEKGTLNARGFARTCRAGGLKGPAGSEGYRNCEELVNDMIGLAKKKADDVYQYGNVAYLDIPNIVAGRLSKPSAKCTRMSTNLDYIGRNSYKITCDERVHQFVFTNIGCPAGEDFINGKCGQRDLQMTGDGVQIISSGSILPVKELVEESNALKRAEEILGPDYTCVSARTHGTEVLCQHKTDKSDFTKVLFAGNKPAGSSSEQKQQKPAQPSASGNGINCQNWDLARVEMEARNLNNEERVDLRSQHYSMLITFSDCFEKYGYTLRQNDYKIVKTSGADDNTNKIKNMEPAKTLDGEYSYTWVGDDMYKISKTGKMEKIAKMSPEYVKNREAQTEKLIADMTSEEKSKQEEKNKQEKSKEKRVVGTPKCNLNKLQHYTLYWNSPAIRKRYNNNLSAFEKAVHDCYQGLTDVDPTERTEAENRYEVELYESKCGKGSGYMGWREVNWSGLEPICDEEEIKKGLRKS